MRTSAPGRGGADRGGAGRGGPGAGIAEPIIAARGLVVRYGRSTVLAGIDIAVGAGEVVTVIGPNGAGKTTLVRALLGLLRPQGGTVARAPGVRVGYLPQRLPIDPVLPLTVSRLMTLTRRAAAADIGQALTETGVAHLADAAVQTLSGGELQRVLLARALLGAPHLLVLDEPVQGVDFAGEAALYELIAGLRDRRGCGVLMVSHDLHVVMAATDRVVCINRHVCCAGTPESVSQHPEYRRLFGPRAALAVAVYAHNPDHDHSHGCSHRPAEVGETARTEADMAPVPAPREDHLAHAGGGKRR